jgi:tetratricopeptide (TPR) repeat protein
LSAAAALSDQARALDPSHVCTLAERAIVLAITDSPTPDLLRRILEAVDRARALDPLSAWVMAVDAMGLAFIGRPQVAVAAADRAMALDDQNFTAHWALVFTLAWCGRNDDALAAAEPALAMSGRHPRILTEVAALHAALGDMDGAEAVYRELRSRARTGYVGSAEQGAAAAAADSDEARALVAQAIALREPYLAFWKLPAWKAAWQDHEGATLLRNMDLTAATGKRAVIAVVANACVRRRTRSRNTERSGGRRQFADRCAR